MSVLALFEENKENSYPPNLPVGFKGQKEWVMYQSHVGSGDFLLGSEKYFLVFGKKKTKLRYCT